MLFHRGWVAVSAAGSYGQGSYKRNDFSRTPVKGRLLRTAPEGMSHRDRGWVGKLWQVVGGDHTDHPHPHPET